MSGLREPEPTLGPRVLVWAVLAHLCVTLGGSQPSQGPQQPPHLREGSQHREGAGWGGGAGPRPPHRDLCTITYKGCPQVRRSPQQGLSQCKTRLMQDASSPAAVPQLPRIPGSDISMTTRALQELDGGLGSCPGEDLSMLADPCPEQPQEGRARGTHRGSGRTEPRPRPPAEPGG